METNQNIVAASPSLSPTGASNRKAMTAALGIQASVTVALHPLVLINIADHWTRTKTQTESDTAQPKPVYGAVTGKQRGRLLEVTNSFELMYDIVAGLVVIDREYLRVREAQYKEVFPEQDFLGWYGIGTDPTPEDVEIHRQFCEVNESPIFLKLDPQMMTSTDKLPLGIYESVLDIVQGKACLQFVPVHYNLVTEEAERIGIDHVARFSVAGASDTSGVTEHLTAQTGALKMLSSRLRLILDYLKAVAEGRLPQNDEILRQCAVLKHCLPVISGPNFDRAFGMQCSDISLVTYLGITTKTCCMLNKLVNKANALQDHRGGAFRRGKGLMM